MKELGGKTAVLVGQDLPLAGGGTEAGVQSPHRGNCLRQGETVKAESETADLWQPKWNENPAGLATAIHTYPRDPLENAAAGSWSLQVIEQSLGEDCFWLKRDRLRGCERGDCGGTCLWRKAEQPWNTEQPRQYCWVIRRGWTHHHSLSPTTHQHWQLNNREAGPSNAWHPELQSRNPPRVPL